MKELKEGQAGLVGKRIRIVKMDGEPHYDGRIGTVKSIDSAGNLHGTWGGLSIVPGVDRYEVLGGEAI